jgi:hypothetical protein
MVSSLGISIERHVLFLLNQRVIEIIHRIGAKVKAYSAFAQKKPPQSRRPFCGEFLDIPLKSAVSNENPQQRQKGNRCQKPRKPGAHRG